MNAIESMNDAIIRLKKELVQLSSLTIDASLNWTGKDEQNNFKLKTIRTLSGLYLEKYSEDVTL